MESIEKFEELVNEISCDAVCETLNTIEDLFETSADILLDVLEEEGASMTELVMAEYIIARYVDVLHDLTNDVFAIEVIECDCDDCEYCEFFNED